MKQINFSSPSINFNKDGEIIIQGKQYDKVSTKWKEVLNSLSQQSTSYKFIGEVPRINEIEQPLELKSQRENVSQEENDADLEHLNKRQKLATPIDEEDIMFIDKYTQSQAESSPQVINLTTETTSAATTGPLRLKITNNINITSKKKINHESHVISNDAQPNASTSPQPTKQIEQSKQTPPSHPLNPTIIEKCKEYSPKLKTLLKQPRLPDEFKELFQNPTEIPEICNELGLSKLEDEGISSLCLHLITADLSFQSICLLIRFTLFPKVFELDHPASRVLFACITRCAKEHPKAIVHSLFLPLLAAKKQIGAAQCEVINRIVKEHLPQGMESIILRGLLVIHNITGGGDEEDFVVGGGDDDYNDQDREALVLFRSFIESEKNLKLNHPTIENNLRSSQQPWNDHIINLLTTLIQLKLVLTPSLITLLVYQLKDHADEFIGAIKFAQLLFNLVSKFPREIVPHSEQLKAIASKVGTFMGEKVVKKLNQD